MLLLLLLLSCVLARDITESRDGDGRAELCTAGEAAHEAWRMLHAGKQNGNTVDICNDVPTCSDDAPDAPPLPPLALDDRLRVDDMASMLDRGFAPCLLPGAAVPGADTALKWENPKRRRGWPGWGVKKQLKTTAVWCGV
jgi:hypothetical protein